MKDPYLKYYDRYVSLANLAFLWDALRAKSFARKQSLINRQKDYLRLKGNVELMALHRRLNGHLLASQADWASHDYGEGYFYQSCDLIGISGLRDTEARVEEMGLKQLLANKTVLEIGGNTGFLALSIADRAKNIFGFDINPHLIDIARDAADYLKANNTRFAVSSFEDLSVPESFDAVLSFASHDTYDGNTAHTIEQYLQRCFELLKPGGLFLFESHSWEQPSSDALQQVCSMVDRLFTVQHRQVLQRGRPADRGRTFIVAQRCAAPLDAYDVYEDSHDDAMAIARP